MTEQEARETMKVYRWSFLRRQRNERMYVYAACKVHGKRQERYIGSLASLESMAVDALVERLKSQPVKHEIERQAANG